MFGKKKAKDECARLTLEYLNEVYRSRMAYGQWMMEGVGGGEGELEGALGRVRDGRGDGVEEAVMARRKMVEVKMSGESDGEEEVVFEDAMEVVVRE